MLHTRERIFPSRSVHLLINLGKAQHVIGPAQAALESDELWLSGIQRGPIVVESDQCVHMFSIQFTPLGASVVLSVPMGLVSGLIVTLHDVRKEPAASLRDVIRGKRCFAERVLAACRWVEMRRSPFARDDAYIASIAARIVASRGTVCIETLRTAAAVSRKKLAADFAERIGVTPKLLARIVRFQHARAVLQDAPASIAEAAAACGYFDQAHMNREFRDLGGVTPREFLSDCYPDGNSIVA